MVDFNSGIFLFVHIVSTLASTISILLAWRISNGELRPSARDLLVLSRHFVHRDVVVQNCVGREEFAKLCAEVFRLGQSARSENIAELWDLYCDAEIAKAVSNGEMPAQDERDEDAGHADRDPGTFQ